MSSYPTKETPVDAPVIDVIKDRWSPMAFDSAPLSEDQIASLFEAARWAPSSYGEQPWRFVYATKDDEGREVLEGLLAEGNAWAKSAGLLVISFAKKTFDRNGKLNRHCLHDTGAANMSVSLQATSMGLVTHQMAGFDAERANEALGVPDDFEPASMMAVGHPGDPAGLSEDLQKRQNAPRNRMPRAEMAMRGKYGE